MDEEKNKQIEDITKRLAAVEASVALPNHYHNGFDSNQVSWNDLYQRKIWVQHTVVGTDAASTDGYGVFLIVPIACLVTKVQEVHQVKGTNAGAVTLNVEKLTGTLALGNGVDVLSTAIDLKGTVNTVVTPTLTTTASSRSLARGDRLALKDTGTLSSLFNVTVLVELQF